MFKNYGTTFGGKYQYGCILVYASMGVYFPEQVCYKIYLYLYTKNVEM